MDFLEIIPRTSVRNCINPYPPGRSTSGAYTPDGLSMAMAATGTIATSPLRDADLETVEAWPMPSPDDFDYNAVRDFCKTHRDYYLMVGNPGAGDMINTAGMIRSVEQVLVDLMSDEPACLRFMDRKNESQLKMLERALEAAHGEIDLLWLGEDLGTQRAPLISKALFRKHIRPRHQVFVDLAKHFGIPVMMHSCGSSSWAYDDFIEMGITVVDNVAARSRQHGARISETFFWRPPGISRMHLDSRNRCYRHTGADAQWCDRRWGP